jgi:hypothetical protein
MKKFAFAMLWAMLFLAAATPSFAGTSAVTLAWDPPEISTDVTGYTVHYGTASGTYTAQVDAKTALTFTVSELPDGTYYFAVTAYNQGGLHSEYSNEVSIVLDTKPPAYPRNLKAVSVKITVDTRNGTITTTATTGK